MPEPCVADIAVLGGGAAGLMAAIRAGTLGARVVLLEKNKRCGAKILISGGGRCNLTTTREGAALLQSFRAPQSEFLRFAFKALPPSRLRAFFAERGVESEEEEYEKVFPKAGRASVVLDVLLRAAQVAKVDVRENCAVQSVSLFAATSMLQEQRPASSAQPALPPAVITDVNAAPSFRVITSCGEFHVRRVIIATGGRSWPRAGTRGDGYGLASHFGHSISAQYPALAPLLVDDRDLRALSGLSVEDAAVSVQDASGAWQRFAQPLLFTHEGLSGPGPMDVSGEVEARGGADVELDFVASVTEEALDQQLAAAARQSDRFVESLLPSGLPQRLRAVLLARAGLESGARTSALRREQRAALLRTLKHCTVKVKRSRGFDHAEVTRGGVALAEIDPRSMESRLVPGLHLCGEVLDLDGPIGGFNFQAAFSTGWVAGEAAARNMKNAGPQG
ncbi:MAG: aminoacetone oxidase family FAD-binding enzyme [Planctomycetes bacterium]|nr:aminoacetone oxidase family FAD-binding enzyme [Planctomycetota bacterium]